MNLLVIHFCNRYNYFSSYGNRAGISCPRLSWILRTKSEEPVRAGLDLVALVDFGIGRRDLQFSLTLVTIRIHLI